MYSEILKGLQPFFKKSPKIKLLNIIKYRTAYYLTWVEDNRDDAENKNKNRKEKPEIPYGWDHFMLRVDLKELEHLVSTQNSSLQHPYDVARAMGLESVIKNGLNRLVPKRPIQSKICEVER